MANSKAISIRVPDELLEKIDRLAEKKYTSHKGTPNRSLVVLDAIVSYFDTLSDTSSSKNDISVTDSVSIQEFRDFQILFSTLSDNVARLEKEVIALSDNARQMGRKNLSPIQLSTSDTLPMSDNVIETTLLDLHNGLTASQLAVRLKETPQIVGSKKKNKPHDFTHWSEEKDPDRYGWRYDEDSKLYYPIKPLV
jgi:metal-responsive CopG/Arc/MetJ family transcriptional regulator